MRCGAVAGVETDTFSQKQCRMCEAAFTDGTLKASLGIFDKNQDGFLTPSEMTETLASFYDQVSAGACSGAGTIFELEAPFARQVVEIKAKVCEAVNAGDVIVILSGIKMLSDIATDRPARVLEIKAELNSQINPGNVLVKLEATGDAPVQGIPGLSAYDFNRDGIISVAEINDSVSERIAAFVEKAGANGDEVIDYKEYETFQNLQR